MWKVTYNKIDAMKLLLYFIFACKIFIKLNGLLLVPSAIFQAYIFFEIKPRETRDKLT